MATDNLQQRLREVLIRSLSINLAPEEIPMDRPFGDLIGLDSMAMLEYVVAIEKEFGVSLDQDDLRLEILTDIPLLAAHIASRLKAAAGGE